MFLSWLVEHSFYDTMHEDARYEGEIYQPLSVQGLINYPILPKVVGMHDSRLLLPVADTALPVPRQYPEINRSSSLPAS